MLEATILALCALLLFLGLVVIAALHGPTEPYDEDSSGSGPSLT